MVSEQVVQRAVLPHRYSLRACIVILGDRAVGHFVVSAHKVGGVRADAHV